MFYSLLIESSKKSYYLTATHPEPLLKTELNYVCFAQDRQLQAILTHILINVLLSFLKIYFIDICLYIHFNSKNYSDKVLLFLYPA